MALKIEEVAALPTEIIRSFLAPWISGRLIGVHEDQQAAEAALSALMETATEAEIQQLQQQFATAGDAYAFYAANPLARRISRSYLSQIARPASLQGLERLDAFFEKGGRRMLVCNHLSYTDTQVTDALLSAAGRADVADRLVAVAGPKVYTDAWRRMAAISLNTRKTPQSSAVATELALPPRELAKIAREAIEDCSRLMDAGYIVLLYPEGTRSRSGHLGPFLKAAARYTSLSDVHILPMAQTGSEQVFPFDEGGMHIAPVQLNFSDAFEASTVRSEALERAWQALAELLPAAYRPLPETVALG